MNGHYIRQKPVDELYELIEAKSNKQKAISSFWPEEAKGADEDYKRAVLALVQERLKYLAELSELTLFFFAEPNIDDVVLLYKHPVDKQLQKNPPDYQKRNAGCRGSYSLWYTYNQIAGPKPGAFCRVQKPY